MRSILALTCVLSACGPGADPCATSGGDPSLVLGGASMAAGAFEAFEPGAPRELVVGPQGGMHVFMHARIAGLCPDTTVLERRVIDDVSEAIYQFGRGPVDFVEASDAGEHELEDPVAIILCPEPLGRPVIGHALRFVASAVDDQGRRADAELSFVGTCPEGADCAALCAP